MEIVNEQQQKNTARNILSGFYQKIIPRDSKPDFRLTFSLDRDQALLLAASFPSWIPAKVLILDLKPNQYQPTLSILKHWSRYLARQEQWHLLAGELSQQEVEADINSNLSEATHHYLLRSPGHNFIVPLEQMNMRLPDPIEYKRLVNQLNVGINLPQQKIISELVKKGYRRVAKVLEPGCFRVRGEQIDIRHPAFTGFYTITLFRSAIEKIDLINKPPKSTERLNLPPNNFPRLTKPWTQCLSNYLVISPAQIALPQLAQITYDNLQPDNRFPVIKIPAAMRRQEEKPIKSLSHQKGLALIAALTKGKPAVHSDHGIGIYEGLQTRTINTQTREYIIIRYAAGDLLSVPVEQAYKVTAYIGERAPVIHRLGGNIWRKTRKAAKYDAEAFARTLLTTERQRQASHGHSYYLEQKIEDALDDSFPWQLTIDQEKAWQDVRRDLTSDEVMDRLIIGDVGFGKTELAIRAARHVMANGKQVALLAPTTLLVQQHTDTFRTRLPEEAARIGTLSRFAGGRERKKVVEQIAAGQLKIIIGTHALLSNKVAWKDLGLVILDEEQRFGVAQKEHFKKVRASVDVLSLSATPIPRTLAMSLAGLKQLSIIGSAPAGRQSVATYVGADNDETVARAIKLELARQGQVYLVAPKVRQLGGLQARVKNILPRARLAVIHGQLPASELATTMERFDHQQIDILIASTIIENGIDLPNANTIIVTHATHFGLADLYQLRGRIGRRDRLGYSYFLYNQAELTSIQRQRLTALTEASRLGSGWAIAQRDLEIRGAGNLLGAEQSGAVGAVGVQLYLDMVQESIDRNDATSIRRHDVEILLPVSAGIPPDYVHGTGQRARLYQQLARARTLEEIAEQTQVMQKRYGQEPVEFRNYILLLQLQLVAAMAGITRIEGKEITPITSERFSRVFVTTNNIIKTSALLQGMAGWQVQDNKLVTEIPEITSTWLKKMIEALGFKNPNDKLMTKPQ